MHQNGRKFGLVVTALTVLFSFAGLALRADTEVVDGITWTYRVSNGEASIGNGSSAAIPTSTTGAITIPSKLGGCPVTSISEAAFRSCSGLTLVTIPTSVMSIGQYAFRECSGLSSMTIPKSVVSIGSGAFSGCSCITNMVLPFVGSERGDTESSDSLFGHVFGRVSYAGWESTIQRCPSYSTFFYIPPSLKTVVITDETQIGYGAFSNCSGLKSVTLPKGLTTIGSYAFYGCNGLTSVTIPPSVTVVGNSAFLGCSGLIRVDISDLTKWHGISFGDSDANPLNYGEHLYLNGAEVGDLRIPEGVTSIGDYAFSGCSGLKTVTISSGVTNIGSSAFNRCKGLMSVIIPEGVTSIGAYAFCGCSGLTSLMIPSSVLKVGDAAFSACNMSAIEVSPGNNEYVSIEGVLYNREKTMLVSCPGGKIGAVTIPDGVTYIGNYAFSGCSGLMSVAIPEGVMRIGDWAFSGCSGLTSMTIPKSVTNIGYSAFSGCSSLSNLILPFVGARRGTVNEGASDSLFGYIFGESSYVGGRATSQNWHYSFSQTYYIPESLKTVVVTDETKLGFGVFENCSGLMSITISSGVKSIGRYAFYGCSGLTSVTISTGVTSIGERAFTGCSGLESVTLPDGVTSIGPYAFSGCNGLTSVMMPEGVTSIGEGAFFDCSALMSVTIPEGVSSISESMFSNCRELLSVTIPSSVTSIRENAFSNCDKLTSVYLSDLAAWCQVYFDYSKDNPLYYAHRFFINGKEAKDIQIPDGVTYIGHHAFYGCSEVTSVSIPASVTSIGLGAFSGCRGLTSVTIPPSVTSIGQSVFEDCSGLISVTIPSSVTSIGHYAFENCSGLTSVMIPEGVTSIGEGAFSLCSGLKSVSIPSTVTSIGRAAFWHCSGLMSLTIPSSVKDIGLIAFWGCSDLSTVIFEGDAPFCSGSSPFEGCSPDLSIVVKVGATGWGDEVPGTWNGIPTMYEDYFVAVRSVDVGAGAIKEVLTLDNEMLTSEMCWAKGCYVVDGFLVIGSGSTLEIEPDSIVKLTKGSQIRVLAGGLCVAKGVTFTHIADDDVGGDANGDGSSTHPGTGEYRVVGNILEDADTQYRYYGAYDLAANIDSDTRLRGHRVYLANSSITVNRGVTLTIPSGVVIKFARGCSITVNGTLDVQGARAAPVVFTSAKDDEWGGDVNGDGGNTYAQAGDWVGLICNGGDIRLSYSILRWGGFGNSSNQGDAIVRCNSGIVALDGCLIEGSFLRLLGLSGGTMKASNTILNDGRWGWEGNVIFVNGVVRNCTTGALGGFATNTIFYECENAVNSTTTKNCISWDCNGYGGMLLADPKFIDPDNGDFRIAADSPCVDAGDGTVAPELDYYGQPRMEAKDVKDTGVPNADGICPDIGIYEFPGKATVPVVDLAVLSLAAPATAVPGEEMTISYIVTNRGGEKAVGVVRDRIVLKGAEVALGGQEVAAGEVEQAYSLAAGAAAAFTVQVKCPAVKSGNWTVGVTVNAERDVFEQNFALNTGWAATPTAIELDGLAVGESRVTIAAGTAKGFVVGAGVRTFRVSSDAALDKISVYGANGAVPASAADGVAAVRVDDGSWLLALPEAKEEKGYVVIENGGNATVEVTVTAEEEKLAVLGIAPKRIAAVDGVSVTITGTGFGDGQKVTLGGRAATSIAKINAAQVVATFDLKGMAAGTANVEVRGDGVPPSQGSVEVYKTTQGPKLEAKLELPSSVRDGRICTAYVVYANVGDEPMTMPVFKVERGDSSTKLGLTVMEKLVGTKVFVGGISPNHPAGVLQPGDGGRIPVYFQPFGTYKLKLSHTKETDSTTQFAAFGGVKPYLAAMSAAATRLNLRGRTEYAVGEFVDQALWEKNGVASAAVSGCLRDALTREPIANAAVSLVPTNEAASVAVGAMTDANGYFQLRNVADGDYRWMLGASDVLVSSNVVTVTDQEDLNGVEVLARAGGRIMGHVYGADGAVLTGATVALYDEGDVVVSAVLADEIGRFSFGGLADGRYTVKCASFDGYVCAAAGDLEIGASARSHVAELTLEKGGCIVGMVRSDGHAVTNGTVRAVDESGRMMETLCAADGTYAFDGLPAGAYSIQYYTAALLSEDLDVEVVVGKTATVDLTAAERPLFYPTSVRGFGSLTTSFVFCDADRRTNVVAWAWDFNDDGVVDSTEEDPTWVYSSIGTNTVRLTITERGGKVSTCRTEACCIVEELLPTVYKDGAIVFGVNSGTLSVTSVGSDGMTLTGDPSSGTIAAGMAIMGQYEGNWFLYRIRSASKNGGTWTLGVEPGEITDIYEQLTFSGSSDLVPEEPRRLLKAAAPKAGAPRLLGDSSDGAEVTTKVFAEGGVTWTFRTVHGLKLDYVRSVVNGETFERTAVVGALRYEADGELSGEVGVRTTAEIPVPLKIVTPIAGPLLDVEAGAKFYGIIQASCKGSARISSATTCTFRLGQERRGNGKAKWLEQIPPKDEFQAEADLSGNFRFQVGFKPEIKLRAVGFMSLGADIDIYAKTEGNFTTQGAAEITGTVGENWDVEANLVDLDLPWVDVRVGAGYTFEGPKSEFAKIKAPLPDFSWSPIRPRSGESVLFNDETENGSCELFGWGVPVKPTGYYWNINGLKTNDREPSVKFPVDGRYPVSLRVTGEMISGPFAKKKTVVVGKPEDIPDDGEAQSDAQGGGTPAKSCDPNEMVGPLGTGDPETQRFVKPGEWMTYTVYFENQSNATASAQEVWVTNPLSEWLDWSTFEMGEVAFNNQIDLGLVGLQNGTSEAKMNGTNLNVRTEVSLDTSKGEVSWYLRIVDPNAQLGWPEDPFAGFLPPNDETHSGEGHLTYRVKVREDAPANARIDNSATIVFDYNDPIETDPAWWNMVGQPGPDVPWSEDEAFSANAANTYEGFLWDEEGELVGIVQVKTAKQSVKTTTDKKTKVKTVTTNITATATVTDANGKKWSYSKGVVTVDGAVTGLKCTTKGCPVPEFGVKVGKNGMEGALDEYAIFGARNGMGTKGDEMMAALEAYKGKWSVTMSSVGETPPPQMVRLQLDVQAKGVVKIAGNWESGVKVSASAQLVLGDGFAYVPVMVKSTKTSPAVNALLRIAAGGEVALLGEGSAGETPPPQTGMMLVDGGRTTAAIEIVGYLAENPVKAGVAYVGRVALNELAYPAKFTQKGLPAGLKLDAATGAVSGSPTKPGEYEVTFMAASSMNSKSNDTVKVTIKVENYVDGLIHVEDYYGPYTPGVSYTVTIPAADGCTVSGMPTGMKWTAKDVKAKDGTVTTPANSVYGIPTKPGKYTVYFKKSVSEVNEKGKSVKVTHTATATFEVADYPTITLLPSLAVAGSEPMAVTEGAALSFFVGVKQSFAINLAGTLDGVDTTVSAKGLPSGLKLVKKTVYVDPAAKKKVVDHYEYIIEGVPTKASSLDKQKNVVPSHVALTASNKYKWSGAFAFDITVVALPTWAYGTFNGGNTNGMATLTVSNVGKISGKWMSAGLTWTLSAASFDAYIPSEQMYMATVIGKSGKLVMTNEIDVTESGVVACGARGEDAASTTWEAWRNGWKEEPQKTLATKLKGQKVTVGENGNIVLTVGAGGAVAAKGTFGGYSASCSTVLIPMAEAGQYKVYLYFPQKTGKFDGLTDVVEIGLGND